MSSFGLFGEVLYSSQIPQANSSMQGCRPITLLPYLSVDSVFWTLSPKFVFIWCIDSTFGTSSNQFACFHCWHLRCSIWLARWAPLANKWISCWYCVILYFLCKTKNRNINPYLTKHGRFLFFISLFHQCSFELFKLVILFMIVSSDGTCDKGS
jgi:hypothetical protein